MIEVSDEVRTQLLGLAHPKLVPPDGWVVTLAEKDTVAVVWHRRGRDGSTGLVWRPDGAPTWEGYAFEQRPNGPCCVAAIESLSAVPAMRAVEGVMAKRGWL